MDFTPSIVLQAHLLAIFWFNWLDPSWSFWQTKRRILKMYCWRVFSSTDCMLCHISPSSSARLKPNLYNLNCVTLVPRLKLRGEDGRMVMGQELPLITRSVGTWERQQLLLSLSPYMWHSSVHLPFTTQICLWKLKLLPFPLLFWVSNHQLFLQDITFSTLGTNINEIVFMVV